MVPTEVVTDVVNSVTIKLEPGLDQIIDNEANNNQESQVIDAVIFFSFNLFVLNIEKQVN